MPSVPQTAQRSCALTLAFSLPLSFALSFAGSLVATTVRAQQSASPDLLPPIEVSPPKRAGGIQPQADRPQPTRRIARAPKPQPPAAPAPGSSADAPVLVSPTGIVTPSG